MTGSSRNMVLAVVAVIAVVSVALVASEGSAKIEPIPTLTPDEQTARRKSNFDALPDYDKLRVSEDIGVYYYHCDPAATYDPISTVLVFHFPSGSWFSPVPLNSRSQQHYLSSEGEAAIEAVIADDALMEQVLEWYPPPVRCSNSAMSGVPEFMLYWNDYDYLDVVDDIRVRFDTCASDDEYGDVFRVYHMPTWSSVNVELVAGSLSLERRVELRVGDLRYVEAPSAKRRLEEVLEDDGVMREIRIAADKSVRCPENPTPFRTPATTG